MWLTGGHILKELVKCSNYEVRAKSRLDTGFMVYTIIHTYIWSYLTQQNDVTYDTKFVSVRNFGKFGKLQEIHMQLAKLQTWSAYYHLKSTAKLASATHIKLLSYFWYIMFQPADNLATSSSDLHIGLNLWEQIPSYCRYSRSITINHYHLVVS